MSDEILTLITYRIERSHESLEEAKILFENGHANTFVNRLYYSCFMLFSPCYLPKAFSPLSIVVFDRFFIKILLRRVW